MDLPVELNGSSRIAEVTFAGKDDLHFVNEWRKSLGDDQNPLRVDAVDFAQVAVYRFEAHSAERSTGTSGALHPAAILFWNQEAFP